MTLASILRPLAMAAAGAAALLAAACSDQGGGASASSAAVTPVLTDVVMGSETAPVTVIEYASFTCPHCRDFYKQDFPRFKANYVDTGKVKYIYRDYPTDANLAVMLVSVSRCKGPGVYYDMVDDIFSHFMELHDAAGKGEAGPMLLELGGRHGLTKDELNACLTHKGIAEALNKSITEARTRGVTETPTLFINDVLQENHGYEALSAALDKVLGGAAPTPAPAPATETPAAPAAPAAPAPQPAQ